LLLRDRIERHARDVGRDVSILDIGGRPAYWENVRPDRVSQIVVLNHLSTELEPTTLDIDFKLVVGDARDLTMYEDRSFDLVHSNSVIEHVGAWTDMVRMASEMMRVGRRGWVQTPAWEFPVEPHYRLPFVHWLGAPMRRAALALSPKYVGTSIGDRRMHVDRINLLSFSEVKALFPGREMIIERFAALPKSYIVTW
jgi:hypothetical protein